MTEPTDAELNELADDLTPNTETGSLNYRKFARAVLARWGQPAHSGEPVAWRYRMSGDMQWQYTERKEQFSHASEVEALTNMQPVERELLTPEQIKDEASHHGFIGSTEMLVRFARAIEAEVRKDDEALIRQLVEAMEYHRDQTRPIDHTDSAIAAARARLEQPCA